MDNGIILIIAMSSITVGSGITEKILNSVGKTDAAQYLDIATKSGLALTTITCFTSFIKALRSLI